MQYICIIFCISIALFSYFKERNLYNPLTLFFSMFGLIIFLASIRLYGLNETGQFTYTVMFIGLISVFFGYFFIEIIKTQRKVSEETSFDEKILDSFKKYEIKYNLVYFLCFIVILFLSYSAFFSVQSLLQGANFVDIRSNTIDTPGLYYVLSRYIIKPLVFVIIPLSVVDFFIGRRTLIKLSFIIILLTAVTDGGRFIFYYLLVHFIITALILKKRLRISNKIKRRIFLISIIIITMVLIVTNLRMVSSLSEHIYFYLAGAVPHLDIRLDLINSADHTYGVNFIMGYLIPILFLLNAMGIAEYPDFYNAAVDLADVSNFVPIATDNSLNAFVTPFFYFYLDGGIFGVIIGSVIYGCFMALIYHFLKNRPNILNLVIYLLLMQGVATSMVRWQFIRPEYALAFIFVFFLFKKRKSPNRPS